jgi:oligopeptide/dipeptide ABC transporter ATP-binding protein
MTDTILRVDDLVMHFPITQGILIQRQVGAIHAVDGISLSVPRGKTVGLVGESGSGKSTIGRCLVRLYAPTSGHMYLEDQDLATVRGSELRTLRRRIQMIFQDPFASLDPRMSVGSLIAEPMIIQGTVPRKEIRPRTEELLTTVGLNPAFVDRYPHEFSGGQRQRIAIARAISIQPQFIIADEPVSALDVSIRAQILNLMSRLQRELGLTYLFISHDLSVVRHVAQRTAVMYLGKIMEVGDGDAIYTNPLHPYTTALLSAVPIANPKIERQRKRIVLAGDLPSPINIPSGCRFHTRCPLAQPICREQEPPLVDKGDHHFAACHFSDQVGTLARRGSVEGLGTL